MSKVDTLSKEKVEGGEEEAWDSIVIGSGMGGLAAASLLSQCQNNHRVLVLEQHPHQAGGCCQSFERSGYPFGVGVHYIAGMGEGDQGKKLLDALTPKGDPIEWTRMLDNYDSLFIGKDKLKRYDVVAGRQEEALIEQFPDEKEAIRKYFERVRKAAPSFERACIFKCLPRPLTSFLIFTGLHRWFDGGFHKYARESVADVVESLTSNEELRAVLEYGLLGVPPKDAPFAVHAAVLMAYSKGAYYPAGGPSQIPQKLSQAITAKGGEIRVNQKVKQILIEGGRAVGVELVDGRKIRAKQILSDAGFVNTLQHMVPAKDRPPAFSDTTKLKDSCTGLSLFVGLDGDYDKDFNLPCNNLLVLSECNLDALYNKLPDTLDGFHDLQSENLDVFVTCPSAKDGKWKSSNPGKTTLEILVDVPWKVFEDVKEDDSCEIKTDKMEDYYFDFKCSFGQLIWARSRQALIAAGASDSLPERLEDADFAEVATPLTFARYLGSDHGAFYGLEHSIDRFRPRQFYLTLRPDIPKLPGLFITGQDVCTEGIVGAMVGGYLCVGKILGERNPLNLEQKVQTNRAIASTTS